jgi:hypothetical protein
MAAAWPRAFGEAEHHLGMAFAGGGKAVVDRPDDEQPCQHQPEQAGHRQQQPLFAQRPARATRF